MEQEPNGYILNHTAKPKMGIKDKYAPVAQSSIRFIPPLLALLGAPMTYAQQTTVTVAPSALTFTVQAGGPTPEPQTITVSGPKGTTIEVVPSLGFTSFLTGSVGGSSVVVSYGQSPAIITVPVIITVGVIWPPQPADLLGYFGSIELIQIDPSTGLEVNAVDVPVSLSITPAASPPPAVTPGGIVPIDGTLNVIQSGEWVSIYGANLASGKTTWNGNFPISLGGATVTINGKAAYLAYVSPTQINLQAPDDTAAGPAPVVVTTAGGTFTSTVTLAQFAPSFLLLDSTHVDGIILRSDGSGAYGGGTYDILGPTGNSLGYATVAAKAGDIVELFGTGFGPTNPFVPAGQAFSSAAPTTNPVSLLINNVSVTPSFAGLSGAGLDQINLTIPAGLGTGDVPIVATVGGVQTPSIVVISLQ